VRLYSVTGHPPPLQPSSTADSGPVGPDNGIPVLERELTRSENLLKPLFALRYSHSVPKLLNPFVALLLCGAAGAASCQVPDLPQAPAQTAPAAAKPAFALPPSSYNRPTGPVPDPKKGWVCDAPPTGVFMDAYDTHPEKKGEVLGYVQFIHTRIFETWRSRLPPSAGNSWAKGRLVKVRFAIMPDGSFSPPEVTVSSGKSDYDRAAIDAIRLQVAFPPPPPGPWKSLAICTAFGSHLEAPDTSQDWIKDAK
jgi:TonB family protein